MRITKSIATILIVALFSACGIAKDKTEKNNTEDIYKNLEFKMPCVKEPVIPDYTVNIKDFGAVEGGQVLNTEAFAKAIQAVSEKGGGRIIIPEGIWLTGPVLLKSNLELHAEAGAMILFSPNKDLYPLIETSFEGLDTWRCMSPIYGDNVENIAFTGSGVWDGSGDVWRMVKKSKLTESQWKKLVASGGVLNDKKNEWYPSEQFKNAMKGADQNVRPDLKTKADFQAIRDFLRPVMVKIQNSRRVLLDGPVFQNSPAWCIHPLMVEDLTVRNVTVRNPWYSQNGDGIDIESCKNVVLEHCNFDVGDDAICIKSGKNETGRKRGIPCENLIITDNIVYHGHGGVTVGSEMSGGVKNMHVSKCTFMGTDVGLRFKSNRGRGGVVEDIFISDIWMTNIPTFAISFNLYYGGQSVTDLIESDDQQITSVKMPVTVETPQFKNIYMRNITVKGAMQAAFLQGLPEMNLSGIHMDNLTVEADKGFTIVDADKVDLDNIHIKTKSETVFELLNCKNIDFKNVGVNKESEKTWIVKGKESSDISLQKATGENLEKFTEVGTDVPSGTITF